VLEEGSLGLNVFLAKTQVGIVLLGLIDRLFWGSWSNWNILCETLDSIFGWHWWWSLSSVVT